MFSKINFYNLKNVYYFFEGNQFHQIYAILWLNKVFHLTKENGHRHSININFKNSIPEILNTLHENKINSVLVEGGQKTIQKFIDSNFWDEAKYFVGKKIIGDGIKGPKIESNKWVKNYISTDILYSLKNDSANKLERKSGHLIGF